VPQGGYTKRTRNIANTDKRIDVSPLLFVVSTVRMRHAGLVAAGLVAGAGAVHSFVDCGPSTKALNVTGVHFFPDPPVKGEKWCVRLAQLMYFL
jgi:hypothetical protein